MIRSAFRFSSLLLSVALLLSGHGLQLAFVPIKAEFNEWTSVDIGLLSSFYFAGFILGCFTVPRLVSRIGHIRSYAFLVSLFTTSIMCLSLGDYFFFWLVLRVLSGVCIAGLYLVIESWLNEQLSSDVRGGVLAVYTVIVLAGLAVGQLLVNAAPVGSDRLIVISALFIVLATVPISLTRSSQPEQIPNATFSPLLILRTSRTASASSFSSGVISGSVYGLGPVYGLQQGMDVSSVSLMMALAITGGALAQYPLGRLSDSYARHLVILGCLIAGAIIAAVALLLPASAGPLILCLFGAAVMPVYALSLALSSDNVTEGSFIEVGTGLLMINAFGSILGPLVTSQLMFRLGAEYFLVSHLVVLLLGGFGVFALSRSERASSGDRPDFKLATTAAAQGALQLDPRAGEDQGLDSD